MSSRPNDYNELGRRVPSDIVFTDGIVRIFCDSYCRSFCPDPIIKSSLTLENCAYIWHKECGDIEEKIFYVLYEEPREGWLYCFNNYTQKEWVLVGKTIGYV